MQALGEGLADGDVLGALAGGVDLDAGDSGGVAAADLGVFHVEEVGEDLGGAGGHIGGVDLAVLEGVDDGLSLHLLEGDLLELGGVTPPGLVGNEDGVRVIEGLDLERTGAPLDVRVVVPTVVEDLGIQGIRVQDRAPQALGRVVRLGHGDHDVVGLLALNDALNLVEAIGGGAGVGVVLAAAALPDGLEGAVVDGGAVVEHGVGVHGDLDDLLTRRVIDLEGLDVVGVRRELGTGGVGIHQHGHVEVPHRLDVGGAAVDVVVVPARADLADGGTSSPPSLTSSRFLELLYTPPTSGMGIWSSGVFAGVPLAGSTSRATGAEPAPSSLPPQPARPRPAKTEAAPARPRKRGG